MKKIIALLALCFAFALPAQAEVSGTYVGLKIIDSVANSGEFSKEGLSGLGIGQFSQNTFGGGIFVGYDFYPQQQVPIRAELEYAIRSNAEESWSIKGNDASAKLKHQWNAQTLFANVYYDFHNSTAFTPYIGGGIGVAFVHTKDSVKGHDGGEYFKANEDKTHTSFAWNAGVGATYAFTENISADLAYRFVSFGNVSIDEGRDDDGEKFELSSTPYANEFSLALRYTF